MAYTEEERKQRKREAQQRYKAKYPGRQQENHNRWKAANPDKARAAEREWRAANLERSNASSRAWRAANPERVAANYRDWAARNKQKLNAKSIQWQKDNPDKVAERGRRRRARKWGADICDFTEQDWQDLLVEFSHACAYCGADGVLLEREHMVPLVRGGNHTKANIVPACGPCNRRKATKTAHEFMGWAA